MSSEDLHRGNVSRRRNPLIADLFRRIEMVEAWGRGMTLIHSNAPAVSFREVAGLFIASFARPSFIEGEDGAAAETPQKTPENTKETPKKHPENTKEQILIALRATPGLSVVALAEVLNKTPNGIRHHLRVLQANGRIRHVGPTKAGYWEILDGADDKGAGV